MPGTRLRPEICDSEDSLIGVGYPDEDDVLETAIGHPEERVLCFKRPGIFHPCHGDIPYDESSGGYPWRAFHALRPAD